VACTANWNFKLKIWPHVPDGSGSVDVSVSSTTAALAAGVGVAALHPQLSVQSVALNIGSVDMSFHGSLFDWLLDLFKGMIENAVRSSLDSAFGSVVADFITADVNPELAALDLDIPIAAPAPYNISLARFGLVAPPVLNTTFMGVALQGDVVPIANPVAPPIAPPALPPFSPADGSVYISAALSPYTLLSAAWTFYTAGDLTWTVPPHDIPLGFNSSAAFALIAPGLPAAFPGAPVQLGVAVTGVPALTVAAAGVSTILPVALAFQPQAPNGTFVPGFTLAANASLALALGVANGTAPGSFVIDGSLGYLSASLSLASSAVGPVNVPLLQAVVNVTFSAVLVPLFDALLAHGLPLPQAPGMALTNPALATTDGAILFSCDFTFDPSTVPAYAKYLAPPPAVLRPALRATAA
jgi:hypothetical protein